MKNTMLFAIKIKQSRPLLHPFNSALYTILWKRKRSNLLLNKSIKGLKYITIWISAQEEFSFHRSRPIYMRVMSLHEVKAFIRDWFFLYWLHPWRKVITRKNHKEQVAFILKAYFLYMLLILHINQSLCWY